MEKKKQNLISLKSSLSEANKEEDQELSKKMSNIINDIFELQGKMNKNIKTLQSQLIKDENNNNNKNDKDKSNEEADFRTKKNLYDAMVKKYQKVMQKFQNEESEITKIKETKLIRTAEIGLGRDLNDNEKKDIIEDPKMIQQIYEDKLKVRAHDKLIYAVKDLEERHKDIKKLEKSILELNQMIIEFNKLVQYQGEIIDNIVENISKSKDYVIKGEEELIKGKENMEKAKKKKCIIVMIVIIILLVILIPTLIKVL